MRHPLLNPPLKGRTPCRLSFRRGWWRFLAVLLLVACDRPSAFTSVDAYPPLFPDYTGVTVPKDMAPLTFRLADGSRFRTTTEQQDDTLWYTVEAWQKGARSGIRYRPFPVCLSADPIDPYIAYRLIEPGYESWYDMGIYQRELSSYREKPIVTNAANNRGCVNCHTFPSGDPSRMLFHARGKGGGTVFVDGDDVRLVNLKEKGPQKQGTYPAWHPSGRYVAFSSNVTHQCFTVADDQPIEVYDTASDIILMDLETGEITAPPFLNTVETWETFPTWSPDGRSLYYCAADSVEPMPEARGRLHYRLMSIAFDPEKGTFLPHTISSLLQDGLEEALHQEGQGRGSFSVSFPRVSPDGRFMLLTASAYATFPIWHKEADLWLVDLESGACRSCDELNSKDTESYHSWSSNGRWIVFSSRRIDGRYTRLYIAHHDGEGHFSKPFLLPQKNPAHNDLRLKSYNVPEFVSGEVPYQQKAVRGLFTPSSVSSTRTGTIN